MTGNGLYHLLQIYGDLGDGLWHCYIHINDLPKYGEHNGINVDSRHGAAPSGRHTGLTLSDTNGSIISVIDTNYITILERLIGMYLISFLWSS